MLRKVQVGVVIVATCLVIISGWLFYRYLSADSGAGGSYMLLSDRIEDLEQALADMERKLAAIPSGSPEEAQQAALSDKGKLDTLDERVAAIEEAIRISPEDAVELPMLKRDIEELGAAILDLRDDYSNWNAMTQNLVTLLYGLVVALAALVVGPRLVRLWRSRVSS